jgi:hypothetical protein
MVREKHKKCFSLSPGIRATYSKQQKSSEDVIYLTYQLTNVSVTVARPYQQAAAR